MRPALLVVVEGPDGSGKTRQTDAVVDAARAPSTARGARVAPGDVIGQGQRNDTLARYACSLRARGVEEVELREAVERVTSATSFEASTLCEGRA